jgi:hypothetical protein
LTIRTDSSCRYTQRIALFPLRKVKPPLDVLVIFGVPYVEAFAAVGSLLPLPDSEVDSDKKQQDAPVAWVGVNSLCDSHADCADDGD